MLITLTDNLVELSVLIHIIQCQELIVIEVTLVIITNYYKLSTEIVTIIILCY